MDFAEEIKSRIDAKEVFTKYGFTPNRAGFIRCPFHGEKTASLKIYDNGRGWTCFGCHRGGDVITFVREYFGLSFPDAIEKINEDFCLGLPISGRRSRRQQLEAARVAYQRKKEIEQIKAEQQRLDDEYWEALARWMYYYDNKRKYAPNEPGEELHPLFVDALANIDAAAYLLEAAECRRRNYGSETD